MSNQSTPAPPSRDIVKRKRSHSPDSDVAQYNSVSDDAKLQYAYDEDLPSDVEPVFHTPDQEQDGVSPKKRKIERPKKLDYVPYMTLRGHKRGVTSVKFSPDGKWIASCCKTREPRVSGQC